MDLGRKGAVIEAGRTIALNFDTQTQTHTHTAAATALLFFF